MKLKEQYKGCSWDDAVTSYPGQGSSALSQVHSWEHLIFLGKIYSKSRLAYWIWETLPLLDNHNIHVLNKTDEKPCNKESYSPVIFKYNWSMKALTSVSTCQHSAELIVHQTYFGKQTVSLRHWSKLISLVKDHLDLEKRTIADLPVCILHVQTPEKVRAGPVSSPCLELQHGSDSA